jgi:hypothetical protein
MSSQIRFRDAAGPADPDSDLLFRYENTVNTPLVSASWLGNGQAVAGVYTIVAASASTVDITADDPKNELVGTGIAVVADDSTVNKGVLGGIGLVFSSSLATGWTGKVAVGDLMDSGGSASDRFAVGIVDSGSMSTQRKIAATNIGSEDSADTEVYALPGAFIEGTDVEDFVALVQPHTSTSRHDLATEDDKTVTFADFKSGPPETADVLVDAVKTIEDAKLDGSELYEHGAGNGYVDAVDGFLGLGIMFTASPGDPTAKSFDLHIRRSHSWVEFAPDVSGSPGTWQSGPLTLTESGEVSGTVTAGGTAYFWVRLNVPSSANPGDMALYTLRARGKTV